MLAETQATVARTSLAIHPTRTGSRRISLLHLSLLAAVFLALVTPVAAAGIREAVAPSPQGRRSQLVAARMAGDDFLLGMYPSASLQVSAVELVALEAWLANQGLSNRVAIAGTFMDFEFPNPAWNIPADLNAAWDQGMTPFINLAVGTTDAGPRSARQVADGELDQAILEWASVYADWAQEDGRWAYIAPLQEMNGDWTSYSMDPEAFKLAYTRIRYLFAEAGVPSEAVVWVFAPNGWSEPGHEFERYYPGDTLVDVVGFSAFNFGACAAGQPWGEYSISIAPYLQRMKNMAPDKPIVLAQTGSVDQGGDRDRWLVESLTELESESALRAVVYFNVVKTEYGNLICDPVDWRIFDPAQGHGQWGLIEALRQIEAGN